MKAQHAPLLPPFGNNISHKENVYITCRFQNLMCGTAPQKKAFLKLNALGRFPFSTVSG